MKLQLVSIALFATSALAQLTTTSARCLADNCARAVTGTFRGASINSARLTECSNYQTCTATPSVTTTVTNCNRVTTPAYAAACSGSARYASACANCGGIPEATVTPTIPAPASLPTSFQIVNKLASGTIETVKLNPDGQPGGNIGTDVLSRSGTNFLTRFKLVNGELHTANDAFIAYAYGGSASKLYFVSAARAASPVIDNGITYTRYTCSLGTYDGLIPGYAFSCTYVDGGSELLYQLSDGDYGFSSAQFRQDNQGGNFVFGNQFYAVQLD